MFKHTLQGLEQSGDEFYSLIGSDWVKVKLIQYLDDQVKLRVIGKNYDVVLHESNVIIQEAA
jgi:hypothetical protein